MNPRLQRLSQSTRLERRRNKFKWAASTLRWRGGNAARSEFGAPRLRVGGNKCHLVGKVAARRPFVRLFSRPATLAALRVGRISTPTHRPKWGPSWAPSNVTLTPTATLKLPPKANAKPGPKLGWKAAEILAQTGTLLPVRGSLRLAFACKLGRLSLARSDQLCKLWRHKID